MSISGVQSAVNAWVPDIQTAIAQEQQQHPELSADIPPVPVVESIMGIESQGDANVGCSPDGYCGLMQTGPGSQGAPYDIARLSSDPEYSIWTGVNELTLDFQECHNWDGAAAAYFSGSCSTTSSASDAFGTSVTSYVSRFDQYLSEFHGSLNQAANQLTTTGSADVTQLMQFFGSGIKKSGAYVGFAALIGLGLVFLL